MNRKQELSQFEYNWIDQLGSRNQSDCKLQEYYMSTKTKFNLI